jgi:hypothetical protein
VPFIPLTMVSPSLEPPAHSQTQTDFIVNDVGTQASVSTVASEARAQATTATAYACTQTVRAARLVLRSHISSNPSVQLIYL